MNTHYFKLKNKITGIQYTGENSDFSDIKSSQLIPLSLTCKGDIKSPFNNNGKIIALLKKQIEVLENELQKVREEAYLAGFKEGRNAGHSDAKKQVEDIAEEFAAMAQSLKDQYNRSIENMNEPLLELAMKVAKKIIGKELLSTDHYDVVLTDQIKQMLSKVVNQNRITIRVNPSNLEGVSKDHFLNELNISSHTEINFVCDNELIAGECVLETEDFIMDGLLSRQLDNIKDRILTNEI
ncbi:MAG: FliH/SctL family protein [Candidatus Hatepunaea meridiana]|nr:FliH/SctL family protein [Candidatus Hatepunaea meridiana]